MTIETAPELSGVYQVMPPLTDFDLAQLKQSIADYHAKHGTPFWPGGEPIVDEDGRVLDGHHRLRACAELGLSAPTRVVSDWDDDDKWLFAFRANLARRHLTIDQRRIAMRAYVARFPAATTREIAAAVGVSESTVRNDGAHSVTRSDTLRNDAQNVQTLHVVEWDGGEDRSPLQTSDHRNDVWVEVIIGYAGPPADGKIHIRPTNAGVSLPYARERVRREWSSGRLSLTTDTPTSVNGAIELWREIGNRGLREMRSHPLATMQ